jgi:hypothetical protein
MGRPNKDDKLEIRETTPTAMAFRSRTGKLIQRLLGRFGKKYPKQPEIYTANPRSNSTRSQTEIDEREFPSANRFDDDEETNWDDAETLGDENSPITYPQPVLPVVTPSTESTIPDIDDWDEALPAATVKNSNIQEARRGKNPAPVIQTEDLWEDDLPSRTFSSSSPNPDSAAKPSPIEQLIGLWAAMLQQFRRFLPTQIRQLSDTILTAILVIVVTIGIWIVDGFFVPVVESSVASNPATTDVAQPIASKVRTAAPVSPEQEFIEAIQTQLSDITSQYSDDMIQTLRVDIALDRLVVQLNPIWYLISDDRQDQVTEKMWLQAKANHFGKLEIQDAQGVSIARSPVVGNHPLILQRRQNL